ncbi:MAG TPA: hypothetical protein VI168_12930 [Croceibacterium sp.]
MNKKLIPRAVFAFALTVCVACWAYTFGSLALYGHPGVVEWTARVTVSALATEGLLWVGALTIGWSLFDKRRTILGRLLASGRRGGSGDATP